MKSRSGAAKFPASVIGDLTIEAYRDARYRVWSAAGPSWLLHLGRADARLRDAQRRAHCTCSALITACNPLGTRLSPTMNMARQKTLEAVLRARGRLYLNAIGEDPHGAWPGEPGFLVFGLARTVAEALGRRFAQNAILWAGADGRARLVLLR